VGHEPIPDKQHNQRAERCADQTGPLVEPVPADGLAYEGCEESAGARSVRRKPLGSFGPGDSTRAIRPATKPITMIQMMFDTIPPAIGLAQPSDASQLCAHVRAVRSRPRPNHVLMALPPTSSVATHAGRRATVVQTLIANPIVAALPRVAVTRHYRR
jgi:hypothetical protein